MTKTKSDYVTIRIGGGFRLAVLRDQLDAPAVRETIEQCRRIATAVRS
jgi:hypothetical protein